MEAQLQPQEISAERVKAIQSAFIAKVYGWMTLALAITGLVAMFTVTSEALLTMIFSSRIVFYGLLIGELALVAWLSGLVGRISATTATVVFMLFAVLNGLTLSSVFLLYTASSIASTFFVTAGTFGLMSAVGYFTKVDLTRLGSLLIMALLGLVIATVVNLIWFSETLYWFTTYAGVAIFIGLIAYDTQKLKEMAVDVTGDNQLEQKGAVLGALSLYLDFINLFLYLLRILGRRK